MQAQPVYDAWKAVAKPEEGKKPVRVMYMSPQGKNLFPGNGKGVREGGRSYFPVRAL